MTYIDNLQMTYVNWMKL